MNSRSFKIIAGAASIAVLGACASGPRYSEPRYSEGPAPVYTSPPPQYANQYAQYGQVSRIETVPVASRPSGAGAVLGAVLGAVVGHQIGAGTGRAVATGVGAVGGAVAGNAIEQRTRRDDEVFRVGVRFDDGSYREFDFQRVADLQVGDRVRFEGGQIYRL
ncbi:MAG TPA: glycine zipper 2TM domain-containing protein [Burkholderiaceae bacterium]|nr:glycine zipper 2TM domain-containing protein [Burkholderiaceae bacterium]